MKRAGKIIGILAGSCIFLGVIFVTVGFLCGIGNYLDTELPNLRHFYSKIRDNEFIVSQESDDMALKIGTSETMSEEYSYSDMETPFDEILANIEYGELVITTGDSFHIDSNNPGFESYVEDGILNVNDYQESGKNIITITVPRDYTLSDVDIDAGAAQVTIEGLKANSVDLSIEAGTMTLKNTIVYEEASFEVGTGQLMAYGLQAYDADFECGAGKVDIEGELFGESSMETGVGSMKASLKGNYTFYADKGIGSILINGVNYSSRDDDWDDDSERSLDLACGIGKIEIQTTNN